MLPLLEHVRGRGARPIIWADMLLSHPSVLDELPRWVVLMDWECQIAARRPRHMRIWGCERAQGTLNRLYTWDEYQASAPPGFRRHLKRYAVDDETHRNGTFRGFYCTDALLDHRFEFITASACRFAQAT